MQLTIESGENRFMSGASEQLRERIAEALREGEDIIVEFNSLGHFAHGFMDEVFGKLLREFEVETLRTIKFEFNGRTDLKALIKMAINHRKRAMAEGKIT
jgi:hypothetical protein